MSEESDLELLRQVLTAQNIPRAPEKFDSENTAQLYNELASVREVLTQFSQGNFNFPVNGNSILAEMLKSLQSAHRHLTAQVQAVANGDFSQRVGFMGEFSNAFNAMVMQLQQNMIDLNERESRLLTLLTELKASEERWNFAVQCSRDGIWDIDLDDRTVWYSDNVMQMLRYSWKDFPVDLHWETKIHSDDLTGAEVLTEMLHETGKLQPFSVDCRILTGQGDYLWTNLRGLPVHTQGSRRLIIVMSDISMQKETEKALAERAMHDHLTGLPNRYLLNDRLEQLVAGSLRLGTPFVFIALDLDYFKEVNDTYGHAAGDQVLIELAKRLSMGLRNTDTAARIGGDEFIVIYPCEPGMERTSAESVLKRFYEHLKPPVMLGSVEYQLRSSVGVSFFPQHSQDLPVLFQCADAALYQAKKNGKNQFAIYEPADCKEKNLIMV